MAKEAVLKKLIDKIEKIVQNRCRECYSGTLTITIVFNQGGIRGLKQNEDMRISFNSDS